MGFKLEIIRESKPKFNSAVPEYVTANLLKGDPRLTGDLPELHSSIVDDFIGQQIEDGINSSDEIINLFFAANMPNKIEQMAASLSVEAAELDWDEILPEQEIHQILTKIADTMERLDIPNEWVNDININFTDSLGSSSAGTASSKTINVNRMQAFRKAKDYQLLYDDAEDLPIIIRALLKNIIGHEVGHLIDSAASITDKLAYQWGVDENKGERVAESWGRIAIAEEEVSSGIVQRESLIYVAKVQALWLKVGTNKKVNLARVFNGIQTRLGSDHIAHPLIESRKTGYYGNQPELYASPYSFEQIQAALAV